MARGADIPLAPGAGEHAVEVPPVRPLVTAEFGQVIVPDSGEILDLADVDDNTLGRLLLAAKDREDQLKGFKGRIAAEVIERMDRSAKWTLHVGGLKLMSNAPGGVDFNAEHLAADLQPLVDEGVITIEAKEEAVEPVTKLKARKKGINALKKLGGKVAKAVERAEVPVDDAKRTVRVEVE